MVYSVIFAGGIGSRMNSSTPKQFLLLKKDPILIYTISKFEKNSKVDAILIVTLKEYLSYVNKLIKKYKFKKVISVISGGKTAMDSQYLGLKECERLSKGNPIVMLHDGVRPLIDDKTINLCIKTAKEKGNAITISPASETIGISENKEIKSFCPREKCILARAPQCFYLNDILKCHKKRIANHKKFVDSASMMLANKVKLHYVVGPIENIKVTTMTDYIFCKLLLENKNE